MAEHYKIVGDEIRFNVKDITKGELKTVKKLAEGLGYKLVPIDPPKKEKEPKPEWTAEAIQKFLEEKGTQEQKDKYWEKFNDPMIDEDGLPVVYKKDSKDKTHKKGEPRVKGHVATLQWFKKEFPKYPKQEK